MSNISIINLYCQKTKLTPPYFEVLKKEGEDHHPTFQVRCTFENHIEIGEGLNLKAAKEAAATKIVELMDLNHKLQQLDQLIYSVECYNVPLSDIWNNDTGEYILKLKKKDKYHQEYKSFKVKLLQLLDN